MAPLILRLNSYFITDPKPKKTTHAATDDVVFTGSRFTEIEMRLQRIEAGSFSSLPNLTTLILNDNPNNSFIHPQAFDEMTVESFKLKSFHLRNNSLQYIPRDLWPDFSLWGKIDVIDLRSNPWACDCHNEWLLTTVFKQIQKNTPGEATQQLATIKEAFKAQNKRLVNSEG